MADALKWKEQNELGNCEISERGRIIKQLTLERDSLREQLELERKISNAACREVAEHSSYDAEHLRQQYQKVINSAQLKELKEKYENG